MRGGEWYCAPILLALRTFARNFPMCWGHLYGVIPPFAYAGRFSRLDGPVGGVNTLTQSHQQ